MCPTNMLLTVVVTLLVLAVLLKSVITFQNMSATTRIFNLLAVPLAVLCVLAFLKGVKAEAGIVRYTAFALSAFLLVLLTAAGFQYDRARAAQWAEGFHVKLIQFRWPYLWEVPQLFLTKSRYQHAYRIKVQDPSGQFHAGWIILGSYWGFDPEKVETDLKQVPR